MSPEEEKKEEVEEKKEKQPSDRILVYAVIALICLVIIFSLVRFFAPTQEEVLTIEDAHKSNIKGKLDPEQGYMYGPHSFIKFGGLWYFQIQQGGILVNVPLRYGPKEVEDIPLYGGLDNRFNNATTIYVAFNPRGRELTYVALAVGELTQSLNKAFGNEVIAVCDSDCDSEACSACEGRPILTCNNTEEAIIHLVDSPAPKILLKGNCIEINGYGYDLVRHVDRLLLEFYTVMKTTPEPLPESELFLSR
ncbi:hypothetical protein KY360_03165 [Candidatus Woesearchaeota archaeon]|nr:hypothetical protein [Candidatus Woesearchaeota archaeon]